MRIIIFCALMLCAAVFAPAQDAEIKIKVLPASQVQVEIKLPASQSAGETGKLTFLDNYADAIGLARRIGNLAAFDALGQEIEVKKTAPGEYQASKAPASYSYDVKVEAPENPAWAAHVSWLKANQGLLMLDDLLPQHEAKTSGNITFEAPGDWEMTSSERKIGDRAYKVENLEKAIFLIGKNWRAKTMQVGKTTLNLALSGEWQFTDDEASEMATSILTEYRKMFSEIPADRAQIFILPLNTPNPDRWRAETRGQTVTVISGALPSKREALQRLHEQLRHEIFHLWIPNAVNLTGNYDWFYEGFTIYQALRIGIWLNQIRFEDYLNTLSRALDLAKNQNVSLVEMSNRRWSGTNNSVYAKGMLVAFLCDLAMLNQSKGKHSVTEVFQKLYGKYHAAGAETDGNPAVIEILKSYPELQLPVKKYVEGNEKLEVIDALKPFGIEISENNGISRLSVSAELAGRQKDLLDKLGYNRWRKLLK